MSAIVLHNQLTHYETLGRGQPIVFLHSWLGSWRTWMPTMEVVADRYRAIALDFWGFGDSARPHQPPTIDMYVEQVLAFLDGLGMRPPHIVGHGLGGVVALRTARRYPGRVGKIMIASTPVLGALLPPQPKGSSLGRLLQRGGPNDAWIKLVQQSANGNSGFDEIVEDIAATDPTMLQAIVHQISCIDLRPDLIHLASPLLAIYGGRDRLLSTAHAAGIGPVDSMFRQALCFERSGHFPFLDQAAQFNRALLDFLGSDTQLIEVKEHWKRRISQREFL